MTPSNIFYTPHARKSFNRLSQNTSLQGNLDLKQLFKFLEKEHGICVPKDFPDYLLEVHAQSSNAEFVIPARTVDSIVLACNEWKQYLRNKNDFVPLFCNELVSMVKTHGSVFSVYFSELAGFQLVNKPDPSYAIIVSKNGVIREML